MSIVGSGLEALSLVLSGFGVLTLSALGLVIIYGMMGVINFAHGELMMIGAYATALSFHSGVPLVIAMILGGFAAGAFGLLIEFIVVRYLYHRPIDSMVATWAVSVILAQGAFVVYGQGLRGISTPFGSVSVFGVSTSVYGTFVLSGTAVALLGLTYLLFRHTEYGLHARATIQKESAARSLGIDTRQMYRNTFVLGSMLAGIAGGLFAPTVTIVPNLGRQFIIEAFVTVIVGGSSVLVGTPLSALSLSVIDGLTSQASGAFLGTVALLVTAIIIIRILPEGLSSYWEEL